MPEATHRLIKKYSNRKLYDTHTRRYITLDDIGRLVRAGDEITVVNRDTGEDLTPAILSQIVAREERRGFEGADGDGIQERGQALLDYLRRTINMPAEIVTGEVERRVGDIETLVDSALERALKRLNMPTRGDILRLTARIDALESRLGRRAAAAEASTRTRTARRARSTQRSTSKRSASSERRTRKGAA
jgi:hypothetical protein